jgi:2-oxoglutarate ferredoxin oxidoreductase subunit alpha
MSEEAVLTGEHFMTGDEAAAEGGIAAGCRFFAGYPITPATEAAERMALRLPKLGGIFIQMEDEIASMNALLGGAWGGQKTMSSTSGPGISLMMENLGLGMMTETPCVIVNVQRGGPSTGLPTLVGQQDMMQARWGSHGDYEVIALAPSSPQEAFDFTIHAFNFSEQYRLPVLVMMDESVGHMFEKVVIPPADEIKLTPRRYTKKKPGEYLPFQAGEDLVPEMVELGKGHRIHVTGLTHDEKGYPGMNPETQVPLVRRLVDKIRLNADKIYMYDERELDDAEVVLVSYGITARITQLVADECREAGKKVGHLRLITCWPFPENKIRELADRKGMKGFVVPEINMGQMVLEVERCAGRNVKTLLVPNGGGGVHAPQQIHDAVEEVIQ